MWSHARISALMAVIPFVCTVAAVGGCSSEPAAKGVPKELQAHVDKPVGRAE